MLAGNAPPKAGDKRAKVLPFRPVRAIVTRLITRLFLHDVRDFLFDAGGARGWRTRCAAASPRAAARSS